MYRDLDQCKNDLSKLEIYLDKMKKLMKNLINVIREPNKIIETIKNNKFKIIEIIEIEKEPVKNIVKNKLDLTSICCLEIRYSSNKSIITKNYLGLDKKGFAIYKLNENMEVTYKLLVGFKNQFIDIAVNDKNEIFCLAHIAVNQANTMFGLSYNPRRIYKYIFENNDIKLEKYFEGQNIHNISSLLIPNGISCNKNNLYVSDELNDIIKYNFDLKPLEHIKLYNDSEGTKGIRVSENTICVFYQKSIFFWSTDKHKLKRKYYLNLEESRLSYISPNFYITSPKQKKIYCFNENENFTMEEIDISEINIEKEYIKDSNDGYLMYHDRYLFCLSHSQKCILKFELF